MKGTSSQFTKNKQILALLKETRVTWKPPSEDISGGAKAKHDVIETISINESKSRNEILDVLIRADKLTRHKIYLLALKFFEMIRGHPNNCLQDFSFDEVVRVLNNTATFTLNI